MIKIANIYPKGARLFIEGQPADGVFLLCGGKAKLTTHSRYGKALILGIAIPGDILGLSAAISDSTYEATAEALEPCHVNFIRQSDFRRFLEQNADAGVVALQQLSSQYKRAHTQIRSLGLSTCVADKLAALLIGWSKDAPSRNGGSVHLKMCFSHEEIAEMIGTSRETVTRLLKDFRERDLISIKGPDLYIRNTRRLEAAIGSAA
ncbi:MAG: Crp/Fnr family transcriptional regulator [Pyrinomonadaceae bacterium]